MNTLSLNDLCDNNSMEQTLSNCLGSLFCLHQKILCTKISPTSQQALFGVDLMNTLIVVNKNGTNHVRIEQVLPCNTNHLGIQLRMLKGIMTHA